MPLPIHPKSSNIPSKPNGKTAEVSLPDLDFLMIDSEESGTQKTLSSENERIKQPVVNDRIKSSPQKLKKESSRSRIIEDNTDKVEEGWAIDRKTGRKYKKLPKTEWNPDDPGMSTVHMTEVDALNGLNDAASTYLAHLQVPPSKKEMEELRAEKDLLEKEQNVKLARERNDIKD